MVHTDDTYEYDHDPNKKIHSSPAFTLLHPRSLTPLLITHRKIKIHLRLPQDLSLADTMTPYLPQSTAYDLRVGMTYG
ncbi:hypothetical protein Pelo_7897 [Pelomyxa schiedti]|nr:hypothetical protein Pelo_7897 [Pelomyxa schiedti]